MLEKRLCAMETQSEMLLKRMASMEAKMDERVEARKNEVRKTAERINLIEQKSNELEADWREKNNK